MSNSGFRADLQEAAGLDDVSHQILSAGRDQLLTGWHPHDARVTNPRQLQILSLLTPDQVSGAQENAAMHRASTCGGPSRASTAYEGLLLPAISR